MGLYYYFPLHVDADDIVDRNDPKQGSSFRPTSSLVQTGGPLASMSSLSLSYASTRRSSLLRLTASETSELEMNVETLKDLFWTLFSKLDAVLQGFRVTYEVAMRIADVCPLDSRYELEETDWPNNAEA